MAAGAGRSLNCGGGDHRCKFVKMVGCVAGAGARRRSGLIMCWFMWRR